MSCVIGIDIGGTNFRIGTIFNNGIVENFEIMSSSKLEKEGAEEFINNVIKDYIKKYDLVDIEAITIGVPSCVKKDTSEIITTPNLKGLENVNLKEYISEKFSTNVIVEKDVNLLITDDIQTNELIKTGEENIIGLYVGTGFGNGIVINGKLYKGKNGVAGEIGHIPFLEVDSICGCGNIGCSETRASGWYLRTIQEKYFPKTELSEIFVKHSNEDILKKYINNVALVAATEINILDPDYVIFGGGVVSMKNFPKEELLKLIGEKLRKPYPFENIRYIFSSNTQKSGIRGGYYYFKNNL